MSICCVRLCPKGMHTGAQPLRGCHPASGAGCFSPALSRAETQHWDLNLCTPLTQRRSVTLQLLPEITFQVAWLRFAPSAQWAPGLQAADQPGAGRWASPKPAAPILHRPSTQQHDTTGSPTYPAAATCLTLSSPRGRNLGLKKDLALKTGYFSELNNRTMPGLDAGQQINSPFVTCEIITDHCL